MTSTAFVAIALGLGMLRFPEPALLRPLPLENT